MLDNDSLAMNNVPLRVKNNIHAINMFDSYSIMSCTTTIPSILNTPKHIYLSRTILDKLTSTYYDDKNNNLELLFQQYIDIYVEYFITHILLKNKKLTYTRHIMKISSIKVLEYFIKIDNFYRITNVYHLWRCLLNELEWFQYQGV